MSTKNNSITIKLGWISLLIYAGIGVLYQLLTGDGPFSWADPWTWVTMALWPLFLLGWFLAVVAVIGVIAFMIFFYDDWKTRKSRAKIAIQRQQEHEKRRRAAAKATPPEGN